MFQSLSRLLRYCFIALSLLANTSSAAWFVADKPASHMNDTVQMLKKVMPAVVNIVVQGDIPWNQLPSTPGSDHRSRRFEGMGSGVIVNAANGYILTNAHILRDSQSITVTLSDDRTFKAKLIGSDPESDVAVIQINASHLKTIPLSHANNLQVGEPVFAIGNPFGLNQTVTSGIVSALQRTRLGLEGYENFIQTDAPINLGNSGGALVNSKGELVGINTAALWASGNPGNIGIGFAIPINMAQGIMQQLIKYGSVRRGLIGIFVQDLTPSLIQALHLPKGSSGALITYVKPYYPAAKAGIRPGDVIQTINGEAVHNGGQVKNTLGMLRVGDRVKIGLLQQGNSLTVNLPLMDQKQHLALAETQNPFLFGMVLHCFDRTLVGGPGRITGVQVVEIDENSMAWRSGIRPGDIIISANQIAVSTVEQLQQIANKAQDELLINTMSPLGSKFVVIRP